jgi:hypothetical protein
MSEWIKCSEQLPEIGEMVLVYRPDAPKTLDPIVKTSFVYSNGVWDCSVQPTHWAPIPKFPKA